MAVIVLARMMDVRLSCVRWIVAVMMDVLFNWFGKLFVVNAFRILLIIWMQMISAVATIILFQCVGTFVKHFLRRWCWSYRMSIWVIVWFWFWRHVVVLRRLPTCSACFLQIKEICFRTDFIVSENIIFFWRVTVLYLYLN